LLWIWLGGGLTAQAPHAGWRVAVQRVHVGGQGSVPSEYRGIQGSRAGATTSSNNVQGGTDGAVRGWGRWSAKGKGGPITALFCGAVQGARMRARGAWCVVRGGGGVEQGAAQSCAERAGAQSGALRMLCPPQHGELPFSSLKRFTSSLQGGRRGRQWVAGSGEAAAGNQSRAGNRATGARTRRAAPKWQAVPVCTVHLWRWWARAGARSRCAASLHAICRSSQGQAQSQPRKPHPRCCPPTNSTLPLFTRPFTHSPGAGAGAISGAMPSSMEASTNSGPPSPITAPDSSNP